MPSQVIQEKTITLCDDGEEPTGILLVGDFGNLTDDQLRWLAAEHLCRDAGWNPHEAIDETEGEPVERGWWRWVKAPEESPHDEIIEQVPGLLFHSLSPEARSETFEAVQVKVGC